MLRQLVVILAIAVLAAGRRAPNADYVAELLKSQPQTGYSSNIEQDLLLDAPGLIKRNAYPQETHEVITSDGYILAAHRIPHGRDRYNSPGDRPVVFIMHGLLSSSADFLVLGPSHALAYTLAEAGYDVWLGNARGNFYSRRHRRYNPDRRIQTFWEFSWDEIGNHDLPAFVDYILKITGQKKLHYIGHSQGGTSFLVLNSLRPEYSEKFISFQGLAPASFFTHNNVSLFNSLANYESILESTAFALGKGEVFANREFLDWFRSNYCDGRVIFDRICNLSIGDLGSREYYNETLVPLFLAHVPAGASIRQIAHFGQVIRFNAFRRYNFNSLRNLAVYGSLNPPKYNLENVKVPSYIHYGLSDNEVNHKDIELLGNALPDSRLLQVARPTFNHFDFIWASDVKELLYNKVLKCMKDAERKQ